MKKSKFLLAIIIALCSMPCICFSLTACRHKHTLTRHEAVSSTCTTDGRIEHWECTDCGKYFSDADGTEEIAKDKTVVAATGHNYVNGICKQCGAIKYSQGLAFKLNAESTGYLVTRLGECTDKEIRIPNEYNGSPVLGIDNNAFSDCAEITSIIIPDNVTTIGDYAFNDCRGLTSITIGNGVTTIGDYAFNGCKGLTGITIGNCVTAIGDYAFNGCSGLTNITIPDSVTTIGGGAFSWCIRLTNITIPDSVTAIGSYAFEGCSSLEYNEYDNGVYLGNDNNPYVALIKAKDTSITSCTINEKTKIIGGSAFYKCGELTSIVIPDSVTTIGGYAFESCGGLTSIAILGSVTTIGGGAFAYCGGLTSITIPDSVTAIGNSAFYRCYGLTSITIGSGVTTIGRWAFEYCSRLTSITIPDSVATIGDGAFDGCSSLKYNEYDNGLYLGNGSNLYVALVKAKDTSITSWSINEKTKIICGRAFYDCSGLTNITIPDSVTEIGVSAFWGCSGLTSVTIGNSVTTIGNGVFEGCNGLTSITVATGNAKYHSNGNCIIETATKTLMFGCKNSVIPADGSVTAIGYGAFEACISLTSITIPDSVTTIGEHAFAFCYGLMNITIPDSVTYIAGSVFYGCSSLRYNEYYNGLYLGNGNNPYVVLIKVKDTSITSCTINEKTKIIYHGAFYKCDGLTSITIPDSVTTIGYGAFEDCISLTSIAIPDSVTVIGDYAFNGCKGLTSIVIGNGLTSIGNTAFFDCFRLTRVYYKGTAEQWNNISIGHTNNYLINATRYYYRETKPTTLGNYWHHINGKVVMW